MRFVDHLLIKDKTLFLSNKKTPSLDDVIIQWSGWRDSNPRSLGPEPSTLPS